MEKKKSIKTLCETRWIERHTTVQNIAHAYEAQTDCLTNIVLEKMAGMLRVSLNLMAYYPVFVVLNGDTCLS